MPTELDQNQPLSLLIAASLGTSPAKPEHLFTIEPDAPQKQVRPLEFRPRIDLQGIPRQGRAHSGETICGIEHSSSTLMTLEEELLSLSSNLKDCRLQAVSQKGVELLTAKSSRQQRSEFLSKLNYRGPSAASFEAARLSQNVVLIDWDDTLMPTYALNLDDRDDTYEYLQLLYGKQL